MDVKDDTSEDDYSEPDDAASQWSHESELVLSEVHVNADLSPGASNRKALTSTVYHLLLPPTQDIVALQIWHCNATPPSLLGTQIWSASFTLASYLLAHRQTLVTGKRVLELGAVTERVLELGAGTGFLSAVCRIIGCRHIIATDGGPQVDQLLNLCEQNMENVAAQLSRDVSLGAFSVRKLDWLDDLDDDDSVDNTKQWMHDEYRNLDVIIAADVIYDDFLTDAFLHKAMYLLLNVCPGAALLLAMEKRYNFVVGEERPTARAFAYLCERINKWYRHRLTIERVRVTAAPSEDDDATIEFDSSTDDDELPRLVVEEGSRRQVELWKIKAKSTAT
ncbi:Methyltransferase-like protein 22 [Sorochytrium milnesiophthora]